MTMMTTITMMMTTMMMMMIIMVVLLLLLLLLLLLMMMTMMTTTMMKILKPMHSFYQLAIFEWKVSDLSPLFMTLYHHYIPCMLMTYHDSITADVGCITNSPNLPTACFSAKLLCYAKSVQCQPCYHVLPIHLPTCSYLSTREMTSRRHPNFQKICLQISELLNFMSIFGINVKNASK